MMTSMKNLKVFILVVILLSACDIQGNTPAHVKLQLIASGFTSPTELVAPQDGSQRLFVADQTGVIWVLVHGKHLKKPLLDIREHVVKLNDFYDERGLLGLALHPNFATNGRFYVSYSAPVRADAPPGKWDHTTYVSEFKISASDPNQAEPNSERVILAMDKPGYNYEAGHLGFGPDGYLYIATGDSIHDPATEAGKYAQDTFSLLGKILRLDVNGMADSDHQYLIPADNPFAQGGGAPEVYAYGFRNPYRFSFDVTDSSKTRLFVGDVGQATMEEVDLVEAGKNYGWPIREGTSCFNSQSWSQPLDHCATQGLSEPIISYAHQGDLSAVIGGIVYCGQAIPELKDGYVFGDWGRGHGHLFAAYPPVFGKSGSWSITEIQVELPNNSPGLGQLLGMGQDAEGELYLLTKAPGTGATGETGVIYKIISAKP